MSRFVSLNVRWNSADLVCAAAAAEPMCLYVSLAKGIPIRIIRMYERCLSRCVHRSVFVALNFTFISQRVLNPPLWFCVFSSMHTFNYECICAAKLRPNSLQPGIPIRWWFQMCNLAWCSLLLLSSCFCWANIVYFISCACIFCLHLFFLPLLPLLLLLLLLVRL